jgi:hypothetical protein
MSEVSLNGLRPGAGFGAWPSLLSQKGKDGRRWHRERNSLIKDLRQCDPPLAQPLHLGAVATTRAGSRFAGVIEDQLLVLRRVDLGA